MPVPPAPAAAACSDCDERPRVAILSSHLGRWPHRRGDWFAALATACRELLPAGSVLVDIPGTTLHPYLQRCGELFGHECLSVGTPRRGKPVSGAIAVRDRLAVELADHLVVLAARPGSRTARLVESLFEADKAAPSRVLLAQGGQLVPEEIAAEWIGRGARGFVPGRPRQSPDPDPDPDPGSRPGSTATGAPAVTGGRWSRRWLVHCTRECAGPWPGQSRQGYLDDLILGRPSSDHSPLAALLRIVAQRRLAAVSCPVAGAPRAVSLSEVSLKELPALRVFRPHRGRWDFEPFGIAIDRDWLTIRGGGPVRYGSRKTPVPAGSSESGFFQPARSRGASAIDWTFEREWRHPGDLSLADLPADLGLVFVAGEEEARRVSVASPWPVTVVPRVDLETAP